MHEKLQGRVCLFSAKIKITLQFLFWKYYILGIFDFTLFSEINFVFIGAAQLSSNTSLLDYD